MSRIFNRSLLLATSIRYLEKEYGEEVSDILAEWKNDKTRREWRRIGKETGRNDPEYLFRLFNDEVHDYKVIRKDPKALEVKVHRCAHAEAFKELNAQDIGMKMICQGDIAVVEGFNPEINFRRPKTLMKGDELCHFIFELEE
jgi:predicted ArsR family transcriptional regulator